MTATATDQNRLAATLEADALQRAGQITLTQARDLMASAVRNSMRDVKASEEAASQIQLLEQQVAAAGQADTAGIDVARQQLATAQAERKACTETIDKLRTAKAAAEGAAQKTAQAAKHHADVEGWDAIAQALAPVYVRPKLDRRQRAASRAWRDAAYSGQRYACGPKGKNDAN